MTRKFFKDCKKSELRNYREAYLDCWDSLTGARLYTQRMAASQDISGAEALRLHIEIRRLTAQRTLLENKRQAFRLNEKKITPPDKEVIALAQKILDDVEGAIKASKTASDVISIADQSISLFNKVQRS